MKADHLQHLIRLNFIRTSLHCCNRHWHALFWAAAFCKQFMQLLCQEHIMQVMDMKAVHLYLSNGANTWESVALLGRVTELFWGCACNEGGHQTSFLRPPHQKSVTRSWCRLEERPIVQVFWEILTTVWAPVCTFQSRCQCSSKY